MLTSTSRLGWFARTLVAAIGTLAVLGGTAAAQTDDAGPNNGNVSLSSGLDIPTAYFFRGIVQKKDGFIAEPFLEGGITLYKGDGALSDASVAAGTWNSLHSDKIGIEADPEIWYENDFYTSLSLNFTNNVGAGLTYTAYTSPNNLFATVEELALNFSYGGMLSPHATFAFELSDQGSADGGDKKGTYLELGVEYPVPLSEDAPVSISVPVTLGLSLSNYYQLANGDGSYTDNKFGYLDVGVSVSVPLKGIPSAYGSWDIHGAAKMLFLGDTTKALNDGDNSQPIASFGIGLWY